MLISKTTVYRL